MLHDDTLTQLLRDSATSATRNVTAPTIWSTAIPARAARRRRRIGVATGAFATIATTAAAVAIAVPLTRTDDRTAPMSATQLVAFTLTTDSPEGRAATHRLSCLISTPPAPAASTSVLSVGGTDSNGSTCNVLQGRRDPTLPSDAREVPGRGGHLYLGPQAAGYRTGYRTFDTTTGSSIVLQIAVARSVTTDDLLSILNTVSLVPPAR